MLNDATFDSTQCAIVRSITLQQLRKRHNCEHLELRAIGRSKNPGGGALCVEMGFYADISWESRCNIEINV